MHCSSASILLPSGQSCHRCCMHLGHLPLWAGSSEWSSSDPFLCLLGSFLFLCLFLLAVVCIYLCPWTSLCYPWSSLGLSALVLFLGFLASFPCLAILGFLGNLGFLASCPFLGPSAILSFLGLSASPCPCLPLPLPQFRALIPSACFVVLLSSTLVGA